MFPLDLRQTLRQTLRPPRAVTDLLSLLHALHFLDLVFHRLDSPLHRGYRNFRVRDPLVHMREVFCVCRLRAKGSAMRK